MKRILPKLIFIVWLMMTGCQLTEGDQETPQSVNNNQTFIYESETGPVEVPAHPQRIVALAYAPNIHALGGSLVGIDEWTKANPLFSEELKDIPVVSEHDPESILAQAPDLIIAGAHMENLEEIKKIAPTIIYTWGKLDYLDQQLEIGKLLNKEEEAQEWINDFSRRAEALGEQIKETYGEAITVSVFEVDAKNVYVFGDNWARGTEILYQAMKLGMPEQVKENALAPGYYTLSLEVLADYAGDFIIVSKNKTEDVDLMKSDIWRSIPAVKNNQVIEIETKASSYSDPITLEFLLDIFAKGFLE